MRPALEKVLAELGIPANTIVLNVGDSKHTKDEDIRNFNNLDVPKSQGNDKQFIILVDKGKEGWNCRSLFGVALFRNPKSKVFVLQATMRCLRKITAEKQRATIFLSKENYDTLNAELNKNFNMNIDEIKSTSGKPKSNYKVHVMPPPRTLSAPSSHSLSSLDTNIHDIFKYLAISALNVSKLNFFCSLI